MQKRFWSAAKVMPQDTGFAIGLDHRALKTPGKVDLVVPTEALAQAIAGEWDQVNDTVDPTQMPFTRSANAAIDKVAVQKDEVAAMLAAYAETDLLCHRADSPEELAARQSQAWDRWLDWARDALDAPLLAGVGVMHLEQPADSLRNLKDVVLAYDPFRLTGLHDLVTISGSLVLGLAVEKRQLDWESAWDASRLEEAWQEEFWGIDEEAAARSTAHRNAFQLADAWIRLLEA